MMTDTPKEIEPDGEKTALELTEDRTGIDINWTDGAEWDGAEYAAVAVPDPAVRPKDEWGPEERRAYLLADIRQYGHPRNLPKTQAEYGKEFGITQQAIWADMNELRDYIRFHAGDKAISTTELVAERAVAGAIEDEDWYNALRAQLEYNEWLFNLGRLERTPRKQQVESVSVTADADDLTDEEREHFEALNQKLRKAQMGDEIVVESTDVEDDGE